MQGEYRTDIQGPSESRWGYTAGQMVDWNGDGLMDLVASDNSARSTVYMRRRAPDGTLALSPGVALSLDGLVLHGSWRNGPAAGVIGGAMALVTSDEQDEAHVYYRVDDYNLQDGGKLLVRDPSSGALAPIATNYLSAGATGRLKYALVDFDRDGLVDLLLGTCGYHAVPNNITGLPACSGGHGCRENGATALLMRQRRHASPGAAGQPPQLVFEWPEWLSVRGHRISYGGQELGIAPIDVGDGNVSLILATPGGRHVFWAAADISASKTEPPLKPR